MCILYCIVLISTRIYFIHFADSHKFKEPKQHFDLFTRSTSVAKIQKNPFVSILTNNSIKNRQNVRRI